MNEQIAQSIVQRMNELWGNQLPTWEEFKKASKDGAISANKTIAAAVIHMDPIPRGYFIIYGFITLWFGFLILPLTIVAWFFVSFSAWWILGALFIAKFAISISREGHCQGMICGAENNEQFYTMLINSGAFLFEPTKKGKKQEG